MKKLPLIDRLALFLLIAGGINWGIIGLFNRNLVDSFFGRARSITNLSTIFYILVGISAIYLLFKFNNWQEREKESVAAPAEEK